MKLSLKREELAQICSRDAPRPLKWDNTIAELAQMETFAFCKEHDHEIILMERFIKKRRKNFKKLVFGR